MTVLLILGLKRSSGNRKFLKSGICSKSRVVVSPYSPALKLFWLSLAFLEFWSCCCLIIGILQAQCSCADPASKLGKCKHAIALLLWCTNKDNVSSSSTCGLVVPVTIFLNSMTNGQLRALQYTCLPLMGAFRLLWRAVVVTTGWRPRKITPF